MWRNRFRCFPPPRRGIAKANSPRARSDIRAEVVNRDGLKSYVKPAATAEASLRDMLHHMDLASQFVVGIDFENFRDNTRTLYAVTRCLEIISEASRRLSTEIKAGHPSIAWKEMAGPGTSIGTITKMSRRNSSGIQFDWRCRLYGPSSRMNWDCTDRLASRTSELA
jgi:hypothetical protein